MPTIKGHIRRSQLITTYGVGAIIPVADEAFMVACLERWDVGNPNLHEPRLQRELGVHGFVLVAPYLAVVFAISRYGRRRR